MHVCSREHSVLAYVRERTCVCAFQTHTYIHIWIHTYVYTYTYVCVYIAKLTRLTGQGLLHVGVAGEVGQSENRVLLPLKEREMREREKREEKEIRQIRD